MLLILQPCPCGYSGDPKRECRCSPVQIKKYRAKISGPLLDRIDLHVEVPSVDYRELTGDTTGESSDTIRARVEDARSLQRRRYDASGMSGTNSQMPPKMMEAVCKVDRSTSALLEQAMDDLNFSARAHDRILKVARTLADLGLKTKIGEEEILEAIQYRTLDRDLWV